MEFFNILFLRWKKDVNVYWKNSIKRGKLITVGKKVPL